MNRNLVNRQKRQRQYPNRMKCRRTAANPDGISNLPRSEKPLQQMGSLILTVKRGDWLFIYTEAGDLVAAIETQTGRASLAILAPDEIHIGRDHKTADLVAA